ncbi:MAG: hypothetical protein ABSH11_01320 [Verrucomicrobiota bacterium]|jgi:tetratricopeptide (TPR) repeat protein
MNEPQNAGDTPPPKQDPPLKESLQPLVDAVLSLSTKEEKPSRLHVFIKRYSAVCSLIVNTIVIAVFLMAVLVGIHAFNQLKTGSVLIKPFGVSPDIEKLGYLNRGSIKDILNDNTGALADGNKAIELDPNLVEAYVMRGTAKINLEDYNGAIADNDKAIELNPHYAGAYVNRACAKGNLKDYAGAMADANKAIELDPKCAEAYGTRGSLKAHLNDYFGAIADENRAIELDPHLTGAYTIRDAIIAALKNAPGAKVELDKAAELKFHSN